MFRQLAGYHTTKMAAILRYDAALAPLVYAGSDLFLMPSRFEPCGLGQMIAMRYGTVPVVRATGGLADTVQEGDTGFTFGPYTVDAFWDALVRGLTAFNAGGSAVARHRRARHDGGFLVDHVGARLRAAVPLGSFAHAGW